MATDKIRFVRCRFTHRGGYFAGVCRVLTDHGDGTYTVQPTNSSQRFFVVSEEVRSVARPCEWQPPVVVKKRHWLNKRMVAGLIGA